MSARQLDVCVALGITLAAGASVLGPAHAASASHFSGTLQLHNRRWEQVRVEVRVGASQQCEENAAQGQRVLRRDASWAVVTAETVCWRREQVPGDPTAGWTPWAQARLTSDEDRDVTL